MSPELAQLILTTTLVLITGYYAWQTRKTVKAMDEANEANNRPIVSISMRARDESISFLDFVVSNAGKGLARDITFKVKGQNFLVKEVNGKKEYLGDFRPIKNGIKVIAPGEVRKYWFVSVIGRVEEFQGLKTRLEVSYFSHDMNKQYADNFDLDFLSLPEHSLGNEPLYKISKESEKIRKEIEQINRSLKR